MVQWLRDGLKIIEKADDSETLAESVGDNGGVYVVPAFTGLGAPYWDGGARGTITGITRGTSKAHVVRAALESIAYQVADLVDAMKRDAGVEISRLAVDGGASKNNFLLQFQSDILNCETVRPQTVETTALGAAFLAGVFRPDMSEERRRALLGGWAKALRQTQTR